MCGKIYMFCKIFKIIFPKMKSSKIDKWKQAYDYFGQLQRPVAHMRISGMNHQIRLNDSTH